MDAAPWYIKPTLWNRFGPLAWMSRIMGLPVPGDEGDKYWPKGYKTEDVGPKLMKGKGRDYVRGEKEKVLNTRANGCPFGRMKIE